MWLVVWLVVYEEDLPEELKQRFYPALYNITGQNKTRTALTVMGDFIQPIH